MNAEKYTRKCADSSVCHIFEKILKLKDLMLTDSGKEESKNRHQIVVDFYIICLMKKMLLNGLNI